MTSEQCMFIEFVLWIVGEMDGYGVLLDLGPKVKGVRTPCVGRGASLELSRCFGTQCLSLLSTSCVRATQRGLL